MSDVGTQAQRSPEIPDKLYFRIGEVSKLVGVEPYVLRFWETEFPALAPKKSGTGQRLYKRKHVEMLLEIKRLLYDKRFTIEGARKHLEATPKVRAAGARRDVDPARQADLFSQPPDPALLSAVRRELTDILKMLK